MKLKKIYFVVRILVFVSLVFTLNCFAQSETGFNPVKLSDFRKLSDFGYGVTANFTYNGQGDESSGNGSYHFGYVWRKLIQSSSISTNFQVDFNHTIPTVREKITGEFRFDGEAGPSSDLARLTYDKYVINQSIFVFGEPQAKVVLNLNEDSPDPITAIFAGVGYGKLYPVGDFNRVHDFVKILEDHDLLLKPVDLYEMKILMAIIKNRWDSYKQTHQALRRMEELGFIEKFPSDDVVNFLIDSIERSQEYEETGSDARVGIHYTFSNGETDFIGTNLDLPARFVFSYRKSIVKGSLSISPWLSAYQEFNPETATNLNIGTDITLQASARLQYLLKETFLYSASDGNSLASNHLELGSSYSITNLLNASLTGTIEQSGNEDTQLSIKLFLGLGMSDL
ncbi:MAG: hypothetical protein U9P79_06530 [Candidatus Cloacimonadota bacterium]|nr:hypothetical protein [Candidatus Cloacimonadota bacterium]